MAALSRFRGLFCTFCRGNPNQPLYKTVAVPLPKPVSLSADFIGTTMVSNTLKKTFFSGMVGVYHRYILIIH